MIRDLIVFVMKPLSFLPALVMMYIIFSFSAQSGPDSGNLSSVVSHKIVEIGNDVLQKDLEARGIDRVAYDLECQESKGAQ